MNLHDLPQYELHLAVFKHKEFELVNKDVPFYTVLWKRYEEEDAFQAVIDILNLVYEPVPFLPITIPFDVRLAVLEEYGEEIDETFKKYKKTQKIKHKLEKLLKK